MSRNLLNLFSTTSANRLSQFFWSPLLLAGASLLTLTSCDSGSETGVDPGIESFPIAYVKRTIPLDDDDGSVIQPDLRDPAFSVPGGDIYIKQNASVSSPAVNITESITNNLGDVKDLDVSSDGKLLVFSLLEEDLTPNDDDDNPTWNIYIYNREEGGPPERVIKSQERADIGDDIAPYFTPDSSRIVFSSNRQKKSRALVADEDLSISKLQFASTDERNRSTTKAMVLHIMDIDGNNLQQISFNQSHDLDPVILSNGRILFSRWNNFNGNDNMSLYTILQDGSDLQPYYGAHDESHAIPNIDDNSLQFTQAKELPDGRIMMLQRPFTDTFGGGEIVIVDAINFVDRNQPTAANQNAMGTSASAVESVTGQTPLDGSIATAGRYSSFYPLDDITGRMLVSKGACRLEIDTTPDVNTPATMEPRPCIEPHLSDPSATEIFPSYGIWLFDSAGQSEKPIELPEAGKFLSEAVVMRPYTRADINEGHAEGELNPDLINENVGLLNIRNIYDFGIVDISFNGCFLTPGRSYCATTRIDPATNQPKTISSVQELADPDIVNADDRPAHFIRLVKAVGIPSRNDPDLTDPPNLRNEAFGPTRSLGMKEIIGYAPIQPDGSVMLKVPSDIAFYFEILDKEARRLGPRHENWLQIKAGDTLTCAGCHRHLPAVNNNTPRPLPLPHGRIDAEAIPMSTGATSGNYPNTQNPATGLPYVAQAGETMAETLKRLEDSLNVPTSITTPSINVVYSDIWTNPDDDTLSPGTSLTYAYTPPTLITDGVTGLTTPRPNTPDCELEWNAFCRTVINYIEHIQPIWEVDRSDPANINPDNTCTNCHARTEPVVNPNDPLVAMVPAGQLDLKSVVPSQEQPDRIVSYRELFFADDEEELFNNALRDRQVAGTDNEGNSIMVNVRTPQSMRSSGARSSFFMEKMYETELDSGRTLTPATVNHRNMLSPAELRLISEYLDIGGQYYNNPFDDLAPQN